MKPRTFFNLYYGREAQPTTGYPMTLPNFDGVQFAVVHPITNGGNSARRRWQVIHVRSGCKITYAGSEKTKKRAIDSAMADIECTIKNKGWKWTLRKAKRAKNPIIVAALKETTNRHPAG